MSRKLKRAAFISNTMFCKIIDVNPASESKSKSPPQCFVPVICIYNYQIYQLRSCNKHMAYMFYFL